MEVYTVYTQANRIFSYRFWQSFLRKNLSWRRNCFWKNDAHYCNTHYVHHFCLDNFLLRKYPRFSQYMPVGMSIRSQNNHAAMIESPNSIELWFSFSKLFPSISLNFVDTEVYSVGSRHTLFTPDVNMCFEGFDLILITIVDPWHSHNKFWCSSTSEIQLFWLCRLGVPIFGQKEEEKCSRTSTVVFAK